MGLKYIFSLLCCAICCLTFARADDHSPKTKKLPTTTTTISTTNTSKPFCAFGCASFGVGNKYRDCDFPRLIYPSVGSVFTDSYCSYVNVTCAEANYGLPAYIEFNENPSTIVAASEPTLGRGITVTLQCIGNSYGQREWTKFGVDGDPSAVVQVKTVRCGTKCATNVSTTPATLTSPNSEGSPYCRDGCAARIGHGTRGQDCDQTLLNNALIVYPSYPYILYGCWFVSVTCEAKANGSPIYIKFNDEEKTIVTTTQPPFNKITVTFQCAWNSYGQRVWRKIGVDGYPSVVIQVEKVSCGRNCGISETSTIPTTK
ncbi:hypothetical protein niasHT_003678 [Heterodera trifolii]|uniref:Effector protein n=1 Tax=Heterodera trifolii TaxID=157864 RepID=A0ABD2M948_9BILA